MEQTQEITSNSSVAWGWPTGLFSFLIWAAQNGGSGFPVSSRPPGFWNPWVAENHRFSHEIWNNLQESPIWKMGTSDGFPVIIFRMVWIKKWSPEKTHPMFRSKFQGGFLGENLQPLRWSMVPTIYKAYFLGLCKGITQQNMARNMVLTYLQSIGSWNFHWWKSSTTPLTDSAPACSSPKGSKEWSPRREAWKWRASWQGSPGDQKPNNLRYT